MKAARDELEELLSEVMSKKEALLGEVEAKSGEFSTLLDDLEQAQVDR